jgi:hypothetical protein
MGIDVDDSSDGLRGQIRTHSTRRSADVIS